MKKNKRIEWIDYAKACTCFLVVLGHIIQSLQKANIDPYSNITAFIEWFIYLFHMPIFMCISGMLYIKNKKDFTWENYKKFSIKKIINLAIPYFTFYVIFVGLNMLFSRHVNSARGIEDLLKIFNQPIAPFWFLYALLSIFLVIPFLEKILKGNKTHIFFLLLMLKIISIFITTKIYFIDSVMEYSVFFYLGAFFYDKKQKTRNYMSVLYFILALIYYKLRTGLNVNVASLLKIFFAIAGIYVFLNIFRNINKSKILDTFKDYTFQIYLTHTIFAAAFRIILLKLGIINYFIHLITGVLIGIYIPVIVSKLSDKIRYTNFFFYPTKTIEQFRERKDVK